MSQSLTHDSQAKTTPRCVPTQNPISTLNIEIEMQETVNVLRYLQLDAQLERAHKHVSEKLQKKQNKKSIFSIFKTHKIACTENVYNCFVHELNVRKCIQFHFDETINDAFKRHGMNIATKWLSHNGKPLNPDNTFGAYNMQNNATIIVNSRLLGGSSTPILRPYTHVHECEQEVLVVTQPHSYRFQLQALATIKEESTPDTVAIIDQIMSLIGSLRGNLFSDHDWLLDVLENFFQIVYWFRKCDNLRDYTVCIALAHKLMTGKPVSARLMHIFGFTNELQGEFSDYVRGLRDLYTFSHGAVGKGSLIDRVRKIYTYLLVQGILHPLGIELSEEEFLKVEAKTRGEYTDHMSMVFIMFDTAITICERVDAYRTTGDWQSLVHDDVVYTKWAKEADRICSLAPFTSNLEAHGTSYFAFVADLNDAVEKGEAICSYTRSHAGAEGFHMKRKLDTLRLLKNTEITRRASQKERKAPFGVLIHGGSSVAKSTFTKMLYYYYGKLHDLDTQDHFRYVRNPADEYWSNFDSSKWCIQMDDIAFLLAAKSSEVDPTLKEMLNVVNNVPYVPPQAALEDKGKTPVVAELVLATTNAADLNAQEYFHCPLAVRRRLPLVVNITPKTEYLAENKKFIDPTKLPPIENAFPDYWEITVQKLIPVDYLGRDSAKLETIAVFSDVREFLKYYGKASMEHKIIQQKSQTCDLGMRDVGVCNLCFECKDRCSCLQGAVTGMILVYLWATFQAITEAVLTAMLSNCICYYMMKFYGARRAAMYISRFMNAGFEIKFAGRMNAGRGYKLKITVGKLLIVGKVLASAFITYKVSNTILRKCMTKREEKVVEEELDAQGNILGTVESQLQKESTQNVWYNSTLELNRFDVPLPSQSLQTLDSSGIRDLFATNCVRVELTCLDMPYCVRSGGVFIKGQWLMFNRHIVEWAKGQKFEINIVSMNQSQGLNSNVKFYFDKSELKINVGRDLAFYHAKGYPPVKDITKYWTKTNIPVTHIVSVRRDSCGTVSKQDLYNASYSENFPVNSLNISMPIYLAQGSEETKAGDCGAIGVAKTPRGPVIVGIHTLGHGVTAGFPLSVLSDIEPYIQDPLAVSDGSPPAMSLNGDVSLTTPHHRSLFRYLESGSAQIYGSMPGFRAKPRSKVTATVLQPEMLEHFDTKVEYGPPAMSGWEPWKKNIVEMVKPHTNVDEKLVQHCVESFTNDIVSALNDKHGDAWKGELLFLSDHAAVNGLPGVKYIDRINTNTSMGHPWGTTKKKFLVDDSSPECPEGVTFTPEIWEKVNHIKSEYAQGRRVKPVFTGHLKDEATPLAKVEAKKTRVFTGAPVDWSLVVRSRLLSFVRLLQKNTFIFEAGPGTVCQSLSWTEIYNYLTAFGEDQIVAGDYGKFDKRMIARFVIAAFEIIVEIHRAAGFSDEELREIMCIGLDTAFPVVNMNGDIIQFFGTNPSGHPLTVVINSLVNSLYMRYAYALSNPLEKSCLTFKKNVHLFTYGDDNIMGVNKLCPWFNHCDIQKHMVTIGVEYTMADKTSESVPYIHISKASFLKREWVWNTELEAHLCPLDVNSIIKSLTVWVPSNTIDQYNQMVSVISSANSEFFFHGKEVFEKHHAFFKKVLTQQPYCHYVMDSTLPGWDALIERFRKASEGL